MPIFIILIPTLLGFIVNNLYNRYVEKIRLIGIQKTNDLYMCNHTLEEYSTDIYTLDAIFMECMQIYASSLNVIVQIFIISLILYQHGKITAIMLPVGYLLITFLVNTFIKSNNISFSNTNQERITNYAIILYLFVIFPMYLKEYNVIDITIYIIMIVSMDFKSLHKFKFNTKRINHIIQSLHTIENEEIQSTIILTTSNSKISIKKYFEIQNLLITDEEIIDYCNQLNLIPDLLKINQDILSVPVNSLNFIQKTKLAIARALNSPLNNVICKDIHMETFNAYKHLLKNKNISV